MLHTTVFTVPNMIVRGPCLGSPGVEECAEVLRPLGVMMAAAAWHTYTLMGPPWNDNGALAREPKRRCGCVSVRLETFRGLILHCAVLPSAIWNGFWDILSTVHHTVFDYYSMVRFKFSRVDNNISALYH
jgi:hypothetical protein